MLDRALQTMSTLARSPPFLIPVMANLNPLAVDSDDVTSEASSCPGIDGMGSQGNDLAAPVLEPNSSLDEVQMGKSDEEDLGCEDVSIKEEDLNPHMFPVFRCADTVTECMMNRNAQVSNEDLIKFRINCETCDFSLEIDQLFTHGIETHEVFTCVCCLSYFKFAKELMVHLYREHRVPPQKFSSGLEFINSGGQDTTLCCVDCNKIFDMSDQTDKDSLQNHLCKKNAVMCDKCGKLQLASSLETHKTTCNGTCPINLDDSTTISTAQLRNRDNSCKSCGKRFSPSKIAAHVRACSQRLNPVSKLHQENGGGGLSDDRLLRSPPILSREFNKLPVLPSMRMRTKLMPELNPVNIVKRSNGWKGNMPVNRSDVEVTLVSDNKQQQIQRQTRFSLPVSHKLPPTSVHHNDGTGKKFASGRNNKRSAAAAYFKDNCDVSITIVSGNDDKKRSGSEVTNVNGEVESDNEESQDQVNREPEEVEEEEDEEDRLIIDETDHSSSRVEHPTEISVHAVALLPSPNWANRRYRTLDPSQDSGSDMYGGVERPKRTLRKVNHDDFMYENLSKRSYQRSHSISSTSPPNSKMTILQQGRQRNSLSVSTGARSNLDQNRKPRMNQSPGMFDNDNNYDQRASPGRKLQFKGRSLPAVSYSIRRSIGKLTHLN